MSEDNGYKLKICMIGEGNVGKTSLIRKFVYDTFDDSYISTIGMKATKKEMAVCDFGGRGDFHFCFTIWDIMGQPGFIHLLKGSYFHGACGLIAICDVTQKDTLYALPEWLNTSREVTGEVPVVFLGNKCDLVDEQEIFLEDISRFTAHYNNTSTFLSSAKTGENVELAFRTLGENILRIILSDFHR
jgi:small GTP-binding protein